MADLTTVALRFVRLYGPFVVAVFTFLESSMLFPFLPSEVVVPAAAALIVSDVGSFVAFVAAAGIGGTVGAFVPFLAFRGPGSRWFRRFEEYLHVSPESRDRARRWFLGWGASSVLWGRFLPGIRSVISIPAGLVGMDTMWFGVFTAVGTLSFYATVALIVHVAQRREVFATVRVIAVDWPVVSVIVLIALVGTIVGVTVLYRRRVDITAGA